MADTYEAFYNGKPLNPNRGLPTMSYAQAEDCGLTDSERLWCRTDGDGTVITADEVPYDSNNSVEDMLKKVSGTITAKEGVSLSIARKQAIKVGNLKFVTVAFAPLSSISTNTEILTLSSGFECATLTDLIAIDTQGGAKPFAISGNTIVTNGALSSGVYYFINSVYF